MIKLRRRDLLAMSAAMLPLRLTAASAPLCRAAQPASPARRTVRTGGAQTVRIGKYAVWVKKVGHGPASVLTLHGGPGFDHSYFECFEDFLPAAGITYWYYDQLGCGNSDRPDDNSLWTIERYCEEVEQVRCALGLDRFILYGHSWGGMLGLEYALRHPEHLSGLVVSNMAASVRQCVAYMDSLLERLPKDVQATIAKYRSAKQFDAPEYQRTLMEQVYRQHFCRLDPWPEPIVRTMRSINANIYDFMSGPDEFDVVGTLRNWDVRARLHEIKIPTLLIAARYDEMPPEQILQMAKAMPRAQAVLCTEGSHMAMYDDQTAYFDALVKFLAQPERMLAPNRAAR